MMASEPFFKERSDAVKMSETPYPTNGSGKNLAEVARFKYSHLCTQACPFRLALLGTFSQRQSVSLCFRVAMILKTQFACLRSRGQLTLRKKNSYFYMSKTKNTEMTRTKKPSPLVGEGVSGADERGKLEQKRKGGNEKTVSL